MTSSRPDTRFLCSSPLTTDLSQWLTNLTASTTAAYEASSARTTFDPLVRGRSIEVSIELDNTDAGTILAIGNSTADYAACIDVDTGTIYFCVGASYIATIPAPNIDGTAKTYIIGFSSYANPLTTGAADAMRSECWVYDVDGDSIAYEVANSDDGDPDPGMYFVVGGRWTGAVIDNKVGAIINGARVSARFHTRVESREHWVAQTAAPIVTGVTAIELQLIPADACVAGSVVGPQIQHAATSLDSGRSRHRLAGPALGLIIYPPPTYKSDLSVTVSPTWVRLNDDGFLTSLGWVWRRRIPQSIERVLPRIQWATWNTELKDVDVTLRVYCGRKPPALAQTWESVDFTRAVDDGAGGGMGGLGVLESGDSLLVVRDQAGYSYFWLGLSITEATPLATNVSLRQIDLMDFTLPTGNDDPPNMWGP